MSLPTPLFGTDNEEGGGGEAVARAAHAYVGGAGRATERAGGTGTGGARIATARRTNGVGGDPSLSDLVNRREGHSSSLGASWRRPQSSSADGAGRAVQW